MDRACQQILPSYLHLCLYTLIINMIIIVFIEPGLLGGGGSHSDTINLYCLYCTSRFARRVTSNGLEIYIPEGCFKVIITIYILLSPLPTCSYLCMYIVLFFPLISCHSFIRLTKESWKQTKFIASLLVLYRCSQAHS